MTRDVDYIYSSDGSERWKPRWQFRLQSFLERFRFFALLITKSI